MRLNRTGTALRGALVTYLAPKLANDAKLKLKPLLQGVSAKTLAVASDRKALIGKVVKLTDGKLARDAKIDTKHLGKILDVIAMLEGREEAGENEAGEEAEDEDIDSREPVAGEPPTRGAEESAEDEEDDEDEKAEDEWDDEDEKEKAEDEEDDEESSAMDEGKLSPEEEAQYQALCKKRGMAGDSRSKKVRVTKAALDQALAENSKKVEARMMQRLRDVREAERVVAPLVGNVQLGLDSAEKIYEAALKAQKVDLKEVPREGYGPMVKALIKMRESTPRLRVVDSGSSMDFATDAASTSDRASFEKEFGIERRTVKHV